MVLGAAAVGAAGATLAALTAGRAGGRQAVLQSAGQQQWRRQLRRDTYGALLGAGAEARDELGAIFADLRRTDPNSEEGLTRIRARLGETRPLINAVRLATAKVYVEGPDSVLETAMRIEEGLVLFHTGLTALAGFVLENGQQMFTTSGGATTHQEFEHWVSRLPPSEAEAGRCPRCADAPRPFPQRMSKHVGWLSASCEDAYFSQAEDICLFSCVRVAVPS